MKSTLTFEEYSTVFDILNNFVPILNNSKHAYRILLLNSIKLLIHNDLLLALYTNFKIVVGNIAISRVK